MNDVVESAEMKYLFRMNTFYIIFEGPDRSGKSTLIKQFDKFINKIFIGRDKYISIIQPVNYLVKMFTDDFLDFSKQEDKLIFQNTIFEEIVETVFTTLRFPYIVRRNVLLDRSLLSNLIYAYTMLDEEHFIKYLYANYEKNYRGSDGEVPIKTEKFEYKIGNPKTIGGRIRIMTNLTPIDVDNEDFFDYNIGMGINPFSNDENEYHCIGYRFNSSVEAIRRDYISNIVYIKNVVYSYNNLDDIERNVNRNKIVDLFSKFKNTNNLNEFRRKNMPEEFTSSSTQGSFKKHSTVELNSGATVSYTLEELMVKNILASFNFKLGNDHDVIIIYDDDKTSNANDVFNNAIDKIMDINYKRYEEEKNCEIVKYAPETNVVMDGINIYQ